MSIHIGLHHSHPHLYIYITRHRSFRLGAIFSGNVKNNFHRWPFAVPWCCRFCVSLRTQLKKTASERTAHCMAYTAHTHTHTYLHIECTRVCGAYRRTCKCAEWVWVWRAICRCSWGAPFKNLFYLYRGRPKNQDDVRILLTTSRCVCANWNQTLPQRMLQLQVTNHNAKQIT